MEEQHFSPQHEPQQHHQWAHPVPPTPIAPEPQQQQPLHTQGNPINPVPVVNVLSTRGVEYAFLTISLFVFASSLIGILLVLVNGAFNFAALSFPISALLISLPVFAFFFLRLKKLELQNPERKLDPSKRRWTQFTQIVAFIVTLFTLVGVVFGVMSRIGGMGAGVSIGKILLNGLCIIVVSGGILAYYWFDEHRGR